MRLLVTGAAGEVGRGSLAALGAAVRANLCAPPERVIALDLTVPADPPRFGLNIDWVALDLLRAEVEALVRRSGVNACLHCASLTGARAEANLGATLALNLDTTRRLAKALGELSAKARLLLAGASAAVGQFPADAVADEDVPLRPASHYGAAKAMAELYLQEVRRAGLLDARVLRLPTLLVRQGGRSGPPSTGYLSDLVRAMRAGYDFVAPAPADFAIGVASGKIAAQTLVRSLLLDSPTWGARAVANLPAFPVTARDLLAALGPDLPSVRFEPDASLMARVAGWPKAMSSRLPEEIVPMAGRQREATLATILADPS